MYNAWHGVFERRIPHRRRAGGACLLIAGAVVALDLHRRNTVDGALEEVEQGKEQIVLCASPDHLRNEICELEQLEPAPRQARDRAGDVDHARILISRNM